MKKYYPLIISLLIFWVAIIIIFFFTISNTGGHLFYTLDDPYIHMAIAKNLVKHGIWGITKYEFTSCSSSPLWTLILSFSFLFVGIKDFLPFVLNVFFASLTAVFIFNFIVKFTDSNLTIFSVIISVLFFSPFITVIFTGLEHSLYTMIIILIAIFLYKILGEKENKKSIYILYVLIILLTLTRYEGLFVAFSLFLIFIYRRKFLIAFLILIFAFISFLAVGFISVFNDWHFFPNSVLLKSPVPVTDIWSFIKETFYPRFLRIFWAYNRIFVLVFISFVIFLHLRKNKELSPFKALIFFFMSVTFLHIQFAMTGSLLRYEMYIIALGIFVNSVLIIIFLKEKKNIIKIYTKIFLFILVLFFSISIFKAVKNVPIASTNIFQMQYQMSKFIGRFYEGKTIALNDIGAVNFYSDVKCVDLWGLANKEIGDYRRQKAYNTNIIYSVNKEKNTEIAIVFESWFKQYGGLPSNWYEAGKWTIPNNITCGSDSVTFYAIDSAKFLKLQDNLKSFSKELPFQVLQKGY